MLGCVVPKRCGCGEPFIVAALSVADTLLPSWKKHFEQALCPACSIKVELGTAQAVLAMGDLPDALLHIRKAEASVPEQDAGDDPCQICTVQGCKGSHCPPSTMQDCVELHPCLVANGKWAIGIFDGGEFVDWEAEPQGTGTYDAAMQWIHQYEATHRL